MSYTISERYKSRRSDDSSGTTLTEEYDLISDVAMTQAEADAAFIAYIPKRKENFPCSRYESSVEEDSLDKKWIASVEWSGKGDSDNKTDDYPEQDPGILPETFSTEGSTVHIDQAYSETRYAVGNAAIPDLEGGIGWDGESFQGADVVRPSFNFTLEKEFDYDDITPQVKTDLANLTGCVNSDAFHGYPAGVVLFMGASGSSSVSYDGTLVVVDGAIYKKATVKFKITFKFRCQPNAAVNLCGLTINKNAWDHVWVLRAKEDRAGRTVDVPLGVYVNQVYVYESFAGLIP